MITSVWLNLERLAGLTAGVKRTYHQLRRGAHTVDHDRHTLIYFGHLDRLRLARECVRMMEQWDDGNRLAEADVRDIAALYSTPWENSHRMAQALLQGDPDPFEP